MQHWIAGILAGLTIVSAGCTQQTAVAVTAQQPDEVAVTMPAESAAPTPQVIESQITLTTEEPTFTPIPSPTPTATPLPTPTPLPTEIPFSYYAPTVNMSFEELVGSFDDINTADPKDESMYILPKYYPPPDTYKIVVDLLWQIVAVYSKDENGEYTVPVRYMLCSTGSTRVGSETRQGDWHMEPVKIRFGQFKVSREYAQYWSLIRSRTYFHSVLYTKSDLSTYQENVYNSLGSKASHACVRLTVPDARWIFYNICYDTLCEVREGRKDDEEMQYVRANLKLAPVPENRVEIIPGKTPYTDNWRIEDIEVDTNYPYVAATQVPVK
ncbi:MAG: L,D-transpeptidase [Clostridia bacterium]|nr:L,D-transpeptidase [Clostridia bacterium]